MLYRSTHTLWLIKSVTLSVGGAVSLDLTKCLISSDFKRLVFWLTKAYINLIEFSTSVYSIRAGTMIFKSLIFEEGAFKN